MTISYATFPRWCQNNRVSESHNIISVVALCCERTPCSIFFCMLQRGDRKHVKISRNVTRYTELNIGFRTAVYSVHCAIYNPLYGQGALTNNKYIDSWSIVFH